MSRHSDPLSLSLQNHSFYLMNCSMKITEDVRKYAAEQAISEKEALQCGIEEPNKEFLQNGTDVYTNAS